MGENQTPFVVVLILSYNGKHLLDDSVLSYLLNDYQNFEVVVIDNGSLDGTKEYVETKYPMSKVIRLDKNQGYSGGFNFGLEYAFVERKADLVLITNNDVKADLKAISALVKVAQSDPKIGFVTGKVYFFDQADILQTVGKKGDPIKWSGGHIGNKEKDTGQYEEICERMFADDIFTLVRRELYVDTGGYDTTFRFQAEEYDWQARAKKLGYKIMYTPDAKIWHKESATIGKASAFKLYYDARNPMLVILLHKPPAFFKRYFWHHVKDLIITTLVNTKRMQIMVVFAVWRGFFSGLFWGVKNKRFSVKHFF
jgi:GT2 family glycosyltransferase